MQINKLKYLVILLTSIFILNGCVLLETRVNIISSNTPSELPSVDNLDNLKKLLKPIDPPANWWVKYGSRGTKSTEIIHNDGGLVFEAEGSAQNKVLETVEEAIQENSEDYSTTNVQVKGVDEADLVKTDGRYIYRVNEERIVIVDAQDPENMKQLTGVMLKDKAFYPTQIYLDQDNLVVIGNFYKGKGFYDKLTDANREVLEETGYGYYHHTGMIIYDIKDKSSIKELREVIVDGQYVSSRKIGKDIYFVANKPISYHILREAKEEYGYTPLFMDSVLGEEVQSIPLKDIQYFPENIEPNYVMVLGLNLEEINEPINISSYLGNGSNIYSSSEKLYIATTNYDYINSPFQASQIPNHTTTIYSFQLEKGRAIYSKTGKVNGRILNQFSMDEYKGYFRIATTTGDMWREDQHTSKNHVYILDQELEVVGKVEDIAPTERIYSMRFMGGKGYMVTFRETDPFFVIDLEDPVNPKVLGYLKIPGYSDYLHPYDENHIIGVGKEVYEAKPGVFLNGGVKVAVFDVTDLQNPKEKFKIEIGDRGTDTPLSYDHKALLFSKEKNLFAFPITVFESSTSNKERIATDSGGWNQFTFQGAYVYHLDMDEGFTLKNTITHIPKEAYEKAGDYWYHSASNIDRVIYIKNILFTLSQDRIKSYNLLDHRQIGELEL